jgi:hypothetical protein
VPPEDPEVVEQAIRKALGDDALVNRAANLNHNRAMESLDKRILKNRAIEMYEFVYKQKGDS